MAVTSLGRLTLDLVARIGQYVEPMNKAERATPDASKKMTSSLSSAEKSVDSLGRASDRTRQLVDSLVATAGVGISISGIIKAMDSYTGQENRLKLVTDSQGELNTAMSDTFLIAQKTASSWDSTAMVYQRFADNADRLGIRMAQTATLTETVSKAISISGGSAASAEAALMQFGQALSSGVLRGEEFNSIAEQAPGLLKAIAQELDVNIGDLRAMEAAGKITSDVLVDALGNAKPYIDDLFDRTDFTIGQSFTQLNNAVTKFVGEAGKGSGAASILSGSISALANNIETATNVAMVAGAYWAGAYVYALVSAKNATWYDSIAKTDNVVATKRKVLADYEIATSNLAATAAMVRSMGGY